jgi:hypothetical protein
MSGCHPPGSVEVLPTWQKLLEMLMQLEKRIEILEQRQNPEKYNAE